MGVLEGWWLEEEDEGDSEGEEGREWVEVGGDFGGID